MVSVSIDNTPVTVTLGNSESTSVPSGETWKVTVNLAADNSNQVVLKVNGTIAVRALSGESHTTEMVLTGGDTIATDSYGFAIISGWVV